MPELNGSDIVMECLKEQGVDTVFGYPGGTILNIYDALYKYQKDIKHILTSHEQGAAHAADGYARATGKVGVCFATSGPGATNLVTGIATAYMDSVPIIAITCNVATSLLGKDSFQEVDILGVTMPITKHNFIVNDINKLADTIRRAFAIARKGRPGPVLIDITKDVTAATCEYEPIQPSVINRAETPISESQLKAAAKLIRKCSKPMIFVGGGAVISDAQDELVEFADLIDAPVCDSLMGKGAFSGENVRYTGMLGMHGTKTSNYAVSDCDLLIAIGTRFSDRVTGNVKKFAHEAKILHIDIDPAEVNKNVMIDQCVEGDVKAVLSALLEKVERKSNPDWMMHVLDMKKTYPLTVDETVLNAPYIINTLYKLTKGEAVITTDVGQHQMWAAQYYNYKKPRTLITSGGLGTMGFGLGACIGAKMGCPDKIVANIAGDGCFRMNMQELVTASRYNIPIIEFVINNGVLGMVRQWQDLFYEQRYSQTTLADKVDHVKVAEALGVKAYRITKCEEVEEVIKKAIAEKGPVLIDCVIDMDDKVWPMVAPGAAISDVFGKEDIKKIK